MKGKLLDDWAFGHVLVTALTFEAYYAFIGLDYVNVSGRVASSFSFVYAPKNISFSRAQCHILFSLSNKPCAVSAEERPHSEYEELHHG
jgi:hypothetical protein